MKMSEEIETKGGGIALKAGQETDWFSGGPNELKNNHSLSPSPPVRQRLQNKSMFRNISITADFIVLSYK